MKFYGELLIFILLFITNARVLFIRNANRDPIVSLAPLSFVLSILFIIAWRLDFFTLAAFVIAFLVLLSNFHAMFRYSERLYVDHYSLLMKIWSFLTMILSGITLLALIHFSPLEINNDDIGVTEIKTRMCGSFKSGFSEAHPYSISNADIYEFTLIPSVPTRNEVILFVPDKRADTAYYRPYLQYLTHSGFTVFSGDFNTSDCKWLHNAGDAKISRRLCLSLKSYYNNQWFMSQREFYAFNINLELNEMFNLITQKYGEKCKIYLVCDSMGNIACSDFQKNHADRIPKVIYLDSYEDYKTPGYGFVEQVDPLFAKILGVEKSKYADSLQTVVQNTSDDIRAFMGLKK